MRMMIWKELRENFKWAAPGMIALFLAEGYVLTKEQRDFTASYEGFTLCNPSFLTATCFGCMAIGAALGAVQILPERRRDQWAALLHRPVSRSVIFSGKVIAGLLLYFFATAIPFLASVWYVATPGHFPAPFLPGMMEAGASDLLLGMAFYSATLLLCLHRGRWFGSQGMILLSLPSVYFLNMTGHVAFAPCASTGYLLAAWGAMSGNGGAAGRRPWVTRAIFTGIVLWGGLTAVELVLYGGNKITGLVGRQEFVPYVDFEVTPEGQFLKFAQGGSHTEVTDMAGKAVANQVLKSNQDNLLRLTKLSYDLERDDRWIDYYSHRISRNSQDYVHYEESRTPEIWYQFMRQNYLAGYDKLSRRCVGYFDSDGFKQPGEKPVPFPMPLRAAIYGQGTPLLYFSGSKIYAIDEPDRRMTEFFDSHGEKICAVSVISLRTGKEEQGFVAAGLAGGIQTFDDKGKPLLLIPYRHDPARMGDISMMVNKNFDRIYLQYAVNFGETRAGNDVPPTILEELDFQGNVLQSYRVPNENIHQFSPGLMQRIARYCPPLAGVFFGEAYVRWQRTPSGLGELPWLQQMLALPFTGGELARLCVFDLVLAAGALLWAMRAGFSKMNAAEWACFVFATGPAGLLTFITAADWPVRVPCPACGRKRAVGEEECGACAKAWGAPEQNGREIFDGV